MEKVNFIHLRERDEGGNIMPRGGTTIAYKIHKEVIPSFISIGITSCSEQDVYSKAEGRKISDRRRNTVEIDMFKNGLRKNRAYTYLIDADNKRIIELAKIEITIQKH